MFFPKKKLESSRKPALVLLLLSSVLVYPHLFSTTNRITNTDFSLFFPLTGNLIPRRIKRKFVFENLTPAGSNSFYFHPFLLPFPFQVVHHIRHTIPLKYCLASLSMRCFQSFCSPRIFPHAFHFLLY